MAALTQQHDALRALLAQGRAEDAQSLWLELADTAADQPDFLLTLIKEFADANQHRAAAELASLLAPNLKAAGKNHEWLFALKLQVTANSKDKPLRAELVTAYQAIYQSDPRLKTIVAAAGLDPDRAVLPDAVNRMDTLLALAAGSYCQHKSWGFGRVKNFDAALNRLVVAFPHNPEHAFQLAYAAESLTPVSPEHIEVRKLTDLPALEKLEPLALLRLALASHNHALTADQLEAVLTPTVIPAGNWKSWWESAKRLAKRDPHFEVPARKNEPVILRTVPVSQQDDLLANFQSAPSLEQKVAAARQFLKIVDEIADPELLLQELQDGLLAGIQSARQLVAKIEAAFAVEDLRARQKARTEDSAALIAGLLTQITDLAAVLDELPAASQKRLIAACKQHAPDRLAANLNQLDAKLLDEVPELLAARAGQIAQSVQNQVAGMEVLLWLCRAFTSPKAPVWLEQISGPMLLSAVLNAIESAEYRSTTKRLRDQLLGDEPLITELLAAAPPDVIRNYARALLTSSSFEELDRRLLLGRMVKEFPFVQDLLVTRTAKEQPLIVSWPSLRRRQAELEDIVQNKIPQNSKEIGVARSYGDLRENFEFKAAKEMQKVLMHRRAELEGQLVRSQGADFADAKTDTVNIGTSVTVSELATGQSHTYHILGAWDSDPARGIISYPAGLAQVFLTKRVGDTVEFGGEHGAQQFRIEKIERVPVEILQSL